MQTIVGTVAAVEVTDMNTGGEMLAYEVWDDPRNLDGGMDVLSAALSTVSGRKVRITIEVVA